MLTVEGKLGGSLVVEKTDTYAKFPDGTASGSISTADLKWVLENRRGRPFEGLEITFVDSTWFRATGRSHSHVTLNIGDALDAIRHYLP